MAIVDKNQGKKRERQGKERRIYKNKKLMEGEKE